MLDNLNGIFLHLRIFYRKLHSFPDTLLTLGQDEVHKNQHQPNFYNIRFDLDNFPLQNKATEITYYQHNTMQLRADHLANVVTYSNLT